MISFDFNLKPKEAMEYLKNKGFELSFNYDELQHSAHHKAFTVAKVTRADLLNDIHNELIKNLEDGTSFEEFKKNLKPKLQKKGWWGEQDITNPKTGEIKTINVGARRLKTIYDTNMRMAYNSSRYTKMKRLKLAVYWRYVSMLTNTSRDEHASMHGTIKHRDDPWWDINKPMNGFGCKCKVTAVSQRTIDKRGWTIDKNSNTPDIASKDFAYDTSINKISKLSKLNLDKSLSKLPKSSKNKAYENLTKAQLLNLFYKKLGTKKGEVFIDKIGDPMVIDDNLFLDKRSGNLKIKKQDRHLFLDELVETIKDPDEIYLEFDKMGIKKNMFKYINVDGEKKAVLAVFRYFKDKTQGATLFYNHDEKLESKRKVKLVYTKSKD